MSTIGYDSWAVDLSEVGAVYPFQGTELILTIIGVAAWIGWHALQFSAEKRELQEQSEGANTDAVIQRIEDY